MGNTWAQSVLSSGSWHKIAVLENGVYELDRSFFQNNGLDPASIDPRNIRIFGFGGGMLPQENTAIYPLLSSNELAIAVEGEEDGSFDNGDRVLFYAKGPDRLDYNASQKEYFYQKNLYSDTTYYFLTVASTPGLRIASRADLGSGFPVIDSYNDQDYHQVDQNNIVKSGREWYGERFVSDLDQNFIFPVEGLVPNTMITVIPAVMGQSTQSTSFEVSLNDFILGDLSILPVTEGTYNQKGRDAMDTFRINTNLVMVDELDIELEYIPSSSTRSTGYLNFIYLSYERDLALYEDQVHFRNFSSTENATTEFRITDPGKNIRIWDITETGLPISQEYSGASGNLRFSTQTSELREFIMFDPGNVPSPLFIEDVSNQDILSAGDPDFVIVTHPSFLPEAQRLAQFRSGNDGLEVLVVTTKQIYNEFSSGSQDVSAIRNFMRYLYDGGENLKYLLLFGESSFNYKDFGIGSTNKVITYQSRNSLHPIFSYASDDYFGFLDEGEGEWVESFAGDHIIDIGVGRFPCNTLDEARALVDKTIYYSTAQSTFGEWRNEIFFVADDGDGNQHQEDADELATEVDTAYSQFNVNKIYTDAFEQVSTAIGETSVATRDAITRAVEKGTLIVNYTGHGGEAGWAEEQILDNNTIQSWENYDKLPLFVTATCEFGRNDDPDRRSGGELLVLSPDGGAISLITTTRPVFASSNQLVNEAFYEIVFDRSTGSYPRLGDVMRYTKNNSLNGRVNRNFLLLGDPSLRLNYPGDRIRITAINDTPVSSENDTLTALSQIRLSGEVVNSNDQRIEDFNGVLSASVFDKPVQVKTLGNGGPIFTYKDRNITLFRGDVSVEDGQFHIEFVVPKNIEFNYGNAKISMYASSDNYELDANGSNIELILGGSNPDAPEDDVPPMIELYMDDTTFVNGDITGEDPTLLVHLFDESGINISSAGVGQEITARLDQLESYILNDFYKSELNTFQSGWVTFPLKELSTGEHVIEVKASDTHNNFSTEVIEFIVADNAELALEQVMNYPNPFNGITTFRFDHNRAGEDLEVTIEIFSSKGNLVRVLDYRIEEASSKVDGLKWDSRGDFGENLGRGLYVYRVSVRSVSDGVKNQKIEKLVIIN